jgi:hypothetical protein
MNKHKCISLEGMGTPRFYFWRESFQTVKIPKKIQGAKHPVADQLWLLVLIEIEERKHVRTP